MGQALARSLLVIANIIYAYTSFLARMIVTSTQAVDACFDKCQGPNYQKLRLAASEGIKGISETDAFRGLVRGLTRSLEALHIQNLVIPQNVFEGFPIRNHAGVDRTRGF